METMTRPGAPGDPAILLSRLLGNNSNYIVINLSEEHRPDRLNTSQTVTVRHPICSCYNWYLICQDPTSYASNMGLRVTAEEVCIVLIVFSLWVWACALFYIRFSVLSSLTIQDLILVQ